MIPVLDPFMQSAPPERRPGDFKRTARGTPQVSDPNGDTVKSGKRKGAVKWQSYSRPSGFAEIIEDLYSIHKWDQRQQVYGFAVAPELVERARVLLEIDDRESQQWKDEADKIAKAAKLAAKADLAADRGSHAHGLAEDDDEGRDIIARIDAGEELGLSPDVQRSLVTAWQDMLERDGLEILAVEMPVVNDLYRAAGTLDRVARLTKSLRFRLCTGELVTLPSGMIVILDLKTGKRRLNPNGTVMYWRGYAVQVFLYGPTSLPYDTETDTRGEWQWEVDGKWALIAHLDVLGAIDGNPSCELILVDLEAGRRAADLCVAAKEWAKDQTVFSVAQIVEGEVGDPLFTVDEPAPSTLPPVPPVPVAGEVEAAPAFGVPPSPALSIEDLPPGLSEEELDRVLAERRAQRWAAGVRAAVGLDSPDDCDPHGIARPDAVSLAIAGLRGLADPAVRAEALTASAARLALVDARAALCPSPDEGGDWSSDEFAPLWDELKGLFDGLDRAARAWRSELASQAKRRHVDFLAQGGKTERRYYINKAIIALALAGEDRDDILRELLAHIIGDVALMLGCEAGHCLGSLGANEAKRFAEHVDAYLSVPVGAA